MNKSTVIDLAQLVRLPAAFTVCSNVIAAHWVASGGDFEPTTLLLSLLASLCIYHGGMVLNDCFDFERDRLERPERPLPSGRVSLQRAWRLGWGLEIIGVSIAFVLGMVTGLLGILLFIAVVLYNSGPRQGWRAATMMGLCRYLNWLLALSAIGPSESLVLVLLPIPVLCYVIALTLISQQETDAADSRVLSTAGGLIALATLVLATLFSFGVLEYWPGLLAAAVGVSFLSWKFLKLARNFHPDNIQALVGSLVFGIIPLDAILLLSAGHPWPALCLLFLLLPGKWLGRKLYVT